MFNSHGFVIGKQYKIYFKKLKKPVLVQVLGFSRYSAKCIIFQCLLDENTNTKDFVFDVLENELIGVEELNQKTEDNPAHTMAVQNTENKRFFVDPSYHKTADPS